MEYLTSEETVQKNIEEDLKYIENEKIAHQANGGYCKISDVLKCITVENMTKEKYMEYWFRQYKNETDQKRIMEVIDKKFKESILPLEEAIEVTKNSKDNLKEKQRLLKVITDKKPLDKNISIKDEEEDEEDE